MNTFQAIRYVLIQTAIGAVLGGAGFLWLDWLMWEWNSGPGSDHSYDYMTFVFLIAGAVLGGLLGGSIAFAILKAHASH